MAAARKGIKELVDEAMQGILTWSVEDAIAAHGRDDVLFVDIRDVRELWRDGTIPGAYHAPRGMIEFWVDPESPYAKDAFQDPKKTYVFFCAAAWRSALTTKTVTEMGLPNAVHFDGGYNAWKEKGGPTEKVEPKR